ncbi:mediator of DNA damage checkpoint protein 1 isoform X2 [Rhipicephalus sanguineus]|uniref:mediator of DNA damage checkpoint protein 1 isoform X2 n=1 Tax=Rhipicephalus sanguineus TaxID=34632 RepID=UPI001892D3CE|nr:mediator of DNA damage checkpoint protein 1 isoform X2 [Rhipicephalus sanguineus]
MDLNDLEMTQVINGPDDSEDEIDREIRAVLKLHDQDAPAAFQTFSLKPGPNVVGRSRTCDVIIENYAVSKQHAVIDVGGHSCTIVDLGSQNKVKIGKRTLKPNCQYNLDYGEEFTIAGLRARVLCDQNNDQEGVDIKALAGCDSNEKQDLPPAASELDVAAVTAEMSSVNALENQAAEKSQDAKAHSSEHQSSGSFNLPEMPNLDYTQTDSSPGTEPYVGAGHEPQRSQEGAETVVPAAEVPASGNAPTAKDAHPCTSKQSYSNDAGDGNARDTCKLAAADEESCLSAETQAYTECPEVPFLSSHGEGVDAAADEMERLNAPTQAYEDDASAEAERLNAPTQAYTEKEDVERLNAVTQPYAADVGMDEEERLNAVTQPYAADNCDDEEKLNAVTQPYTVSVNEEEEERLNAVTQPYAAANVSQSEHDRMNDVTHSFNDEEDDMVGDSVCAPTQPEERHRRLLTGPSELSFVLCEASQPCREDYGEGDDEEFCAPTQKDESPPLKVHALLKHRRERGPVAEDDDKTPPLSPKTTVDETPPPSPGFVPESDPEDDGDASMVTALHSPSLLNVTGTTVYEDCVTPGSGITSPVLGKVSARRQRRGMSLKKPTCDTVLELPSQESAAGAEWMQQQQQQEDSSSQSKASRKLTYVAEAGEDNDLDLRAADAPLAEPLVSEVERTDGIVTTTCSSPSIPVKPQESVNANESMSAEYSEMPLLHMSEDIDLDGAATDKEDSTACDTTAVQEKGPAEACTSSEIPASTGRSSSDGTVPKEACEEEQEETLEKDEPANAPSKNESSTASLRKGSEEPSAEPETVPEKTCEEEQALKNDEPANVSSESEEEGSRVSKRRGKKKPPARTARRTRKAASTNEAKKDPVENNTVPTRRSSGRQNAGSRMKSLLSLEKRTSASGAFKESELSQEVNDERGTRDDDGPAGESHGKAGRPRTRRGLKGKAAAKEDEPEVAPPCPSKNLPSARESDVPSSSDGDENKKPSVKPGEDDVEGEAETSDGTRVDNNEECQPKAGPSGHQEGEDADDALSTASLTPSLGDGDVSCTNATIDTCFSEPLPTFSEVMAECQPYIGDTEAQDEKNEPAEEQEDTAAEPAAESKATAPAVSEPEPAVVEPVRASRSKRPRGGVSTTNLKASKVDEELPKTRRKVARGAREEPLAEAEVLAEDPASSVEQPEAPQLSNGAKRGRLYSSAVGRRAVPSVADVVSKISEDVEESEGETDKDLAEDHTSSVQRSEAKQSAASQQSNRARRGRPFHHGAGKNAVPSVSNKIVEDVEQSEGETEPHLAEERLSGVEQPEAAQSAASQQSNRARRGRPFRSAVGRKAVPNITAAKVTEDLEQSEGDRNTDRLSAQETESIDGTLSEASECSPSSRRKAIPHIEVSKATCRGARRLLQLNAKRGGEEAASESDTDHLSAQDTESIHGTPSNAGETLTSEAEPVPSQSLSRASARRGAKNARLSLRRDTEQADQAASEGPAAENIEEPPQNVRASQRGRTSAKTRSGREEEASDVAAADVSLECVELSQSPRTSQRDKRGAKISREKDEPFVQSLLDDSTQSLQTEAHSQNSRSSQRGRRNAKKPETQDNLTSEENQDVPPVQSAVDDSTQSLSTESHSQASRSAQRGRRNAKKPETLDNLTPEENQDAPPVQSAVDDSTQSLDTESHSQTSRSSQRTRRNVKQIETQDLTPEETEDTHVESVLDDSTQSLSMESHSKTSQGSLLGKRNAKKPKMQNKLTAEGTGDAPPVQSTLDDSTHSLSKECQSQNSRSSRLGRRNVKQPETMNNATPEGTDVQTDVDAQDAKPSRHGRKALKLSQEVGSRTIASAGENTLASAEPGTQRTRRGGDTAETSSQNEQVRLAPEAAEGVEPSENASTEVVPRSAPTRRGRKAAQPTRKRGGSKNVPEDDTVTETFDTPEPTNPRSSKALRTANLSLPKPTEDTEVLVKVEPPSPRTSQRRSAKTAQVSSEETEQTNNGDSAKVSSRFKRKVTKVNTKDVTAEAETEEALSSESTSRSPTSRMPAPPVPVTRKRDARRAGRKDDPSPPTVEPVLETSEETSLLCPVQRVGRKRHIASMSFGEARHESDDEAVDNEQETLDEVTVKLGSKSRRKAPAKEAAIKQEVVEKAPARRGKRKADLPKAEAPQEAKARQDEQVDSSPAPKKTAKVKPKVLFTGIDDTRTEEQVVRDLGGIIATNASACTHLVTDKFRRTVKALCCIGKGTPIVDVAWIKKCQEAGAFVDHVPHMLLDKKAEKALNFNLRDTLTKASTGGVLRGWSVHATAHVLPSPSDMKEIVACAGGKYLDNLPARTSTGTTVVISCKQDLKACARVRNHGIPVVAAEFILSGLLQHNLNVDAHRLE